VLPDRRRPGQFNVTVAAAAVAAIDPTGTTGEVGSLYVHPDHQRDGLGRELLHQLATRLQAIGVQTLHIGVIATNVEAQCFYEALGGQLGGERVFDEDGDLLPERIYIWPEFTTLLTQPLIRRRSSRRTHTPDHLLTRLAARESATDHRLQGGVAKVWVGAPA